MITHSKMLDVNLDITFIVIAIVNANMRHPVESLSRKIGETPYILLVMFHEIFKLFNLSNIQ